MGDVEGGYQGREKFKKIRYFGLPTTCSLPTTAFLERKDGYVAEKFIIGMNC